MDVLGGFGARAPPQLGDPFAGWICMLRTLAVTLALAGAAALPTGLASATAQDERPRVIAKAECRQDNPDATRRETRQCARKAVRAARRECRAERRADRAAFRAKYGERPRRACARARLTD